MLWFINEIAYGSLEQISPYSESYMDNCGNTGANTCNYTPTQGGVQLLEQTKRSRTLFVDSE